MTLPSSPRPNVSLLSLRYAPLPVEVELILNGLSVVKGPWTVNLTRDGAPIPHPAQFRIRHRLEDRARFYVELRGRCPDGTILQRQCLLLRNRPWALLADTIQLPRRARIDYRATLSLSSGWAAKPNRLSRAISLRRRGASVAVLPLGLPQWRVENAWGSLTTDDTFMSLHAHTIARRLFVPLLIDAAPAPVHQIRWQSLTVSHRRRPVTPEIAVAYRIRSRGPDHALLYHSLAPRALRSFLGHQTQRSRLFGWFNASGKVQPVLQVE